MEPVISHAEPVIAVNDIIETVTYWHQVIGFPDKWIWGDPPTHGGVSWQGAFVQFSYNPVLAGLSKGNSIWIRVRHVESLYEFHQEKNIEIVAKLKLHSYGMAQYTIREINGIYIHFAGTPQTDRTQHTPAVPGLVQIIARQPTPAESQMLAVAVGWSSPGNDPAPERQRSAVVFAVTAENIATGEVVGCAYLLGDQAGFYYIKDVMVHPAWQSRRVGTAMMKELSSWLEKAAPENAFVALHTPENLAPFYQQFGFGASFSMVRIINQVRQEDSPVS